MVRQSAGGRPLHEGWFPPATVGAGWSDFLHGASGLYTHVLPLTQDGNCNFFYGPASAIWHHLLHHILVATQGTTASEGRTAWGTGHAAGIIFGNTIYPEIKPLAVSQVCPHSPTPCLFSPAVQTWPIL